MIIATAGHVDHGKTSLIKALTGTDTDRLPEAKKRGLTIEAGFASYHCDNIEPGFLYWPLYTSDAAEDMHYVNLG